jgi:hypothetical protein
MPAVATQAASATEQAPPADLAAATDQASETLQANATTWSPEALEDLLAPVALYPDPVLMQLLIAVTNPQEVLDAGNWLIANPDVTGKAQEDAAESAGFTLPMRAVMQFPEVVDQLCLNMPWTEELGQAYVNDQQGVMDAVQRLRVQARDVGNLESSPQMQVKSSKPAPSEPEVISITPPASQVVYVPQYDPQAVYAPPGSTVTTTTGGTTTTVTSPPATTVSNTTTTSTQTTDAGHSTGSLVATGLLAFGAGMLVNEIFDDDDDWYGPSYYGPMWHRPMPYYPPYPYRPVYGPGFYPAHGYVRPNNYIRGGNAVVINNNNNYFNRYNSPASVARTRASPRSPISAARPNRPELQQLNTRAERGPVRNAPAASEAWKGRSGYAGTDPKVRQSLDRQAASSKLAQSNRPAARDTPRVDGKPVAPKVQGAYAGARPARDTASAGGARDDAARPQARAQREQRPAVQQRPDPAERPDLAQRSATRDAGGARDFGSGADRGRPSLPEGAGTARREASTSPTAFSHHSQPGRTASLSSERGRQSAPAGHAARARAGGHRR